MHEHYLIPVYSITWWLGIFISFAFFFILSQVGNCLREKGQEQSFRRGLFIFFLIREFTIHLYFISTGAFTFQDSLPLHMCGISYIACLFCLYKPIPLLYEFVLMLGSVGAFMSFITPEMTHGYSPVLLIDYYLSHGMIIFTPLYLFFVLKIRPRINSWMYVLLLGNVILLSVGILNYFLGSNYIYLCEPPKVDNVLVTGKFPYHIFGFEIIGTIFVIVLYNVYRKLKFNLLNNTQKLIKWC